MMMKITDKQEIALEMSDDNNSFVAVNFDRDNRCIELLEGRLVDGVAVDVTVTTMGQPQWADMTQEQWDSIVDEEERKFYALNKTCNDIFAQTQGVTH
jgi:hypothetical protein